MEQVPGHLGWSMKPASGVDGGLPPSKSARQQKQTTTRSKRLVVVDCRCGRLASPLTDLAFCVPVVIIIIIIKCMAKSPA